MEQEMHFKEMVDSVKLNKRQKSSILDEYMVLTICF
jgi:hypothetical protein